MPAKKTTKKAVKKAAAKKSSAPKAAKKAPAKKVAVKQTVDNKAPAKQATTKTLAKKAPAKEGATDVVTKRSATTSIIANVDVGFGNSLYIRGEGAGLSWDKGIELVNVSPYEWSFSTNAATGPVTFKFLINDEAWTDGDNLAVAPGGRSVSSPVFSW